jgi:hypothetical protein
MNENENKYYINEICSHCDSYESNGMDEFDDIKEIEPIWMEWMTHAVLRTWMNYG